MTKIIKTKEQWQAQLDALAFHVCREKGTERAFTGKYWDCVKEGVYHCACCGEALFLSEDKFDAGCGWPSYSKPVDAKAIEQANDLSHGMQRIEVLCKKCDAHLGHVFNDGPAPTGLRYCINSISLTLKEK